MPATCGLRLICKRIFVCLIGMLEVGKNESAVFVNERFPEDLRDRLREIAIDLLRNKAKAANGLAIRATSPAGAGFSQRLTLRQNQIVAMLKIGSSNKEIAHVLRLSEGTIKVHLHRIYQRIGVLQPHSIGCPVICGRVGCCAKTSHL